jgi:hypothetical protein
VFGTGEREEFGPRDRGRNNKVQIASFAATGNALARSFGRCYDALEGELERPLVGVGGRPRNFLHRILGRSAPLVPPAVPL